METEMYVLTEEFKGYDEDKVYLRGVTADPRVSGTWRNSSTRDKCRGSELLPIILDIADLKRISK